MSDVRKDPGAPDAPGPDTKIETSRGFAQWLHQTGCSFAFTSYQSGKLFLVGRLPDGKVSLHQQSFERAMGLHAGRDRLYLGTAYRLWRLENTLGPGERANAHFDALYTPRNAQTTGDLDIHEVSVDAHGRVVFVNTKFSCLATLSPRYGFQPLWMPPFISKLVAEDRCHLNGLAMQDGRPAYVTAVSRSDTLTGWRERRHEGGVLMEVPSGRIVTDTLSMPHSPRIHDGKLWVLDSGRGYLVQVDPESGERKDIVFCPGFLRGLAFCGRYALVTVSLPRNGAFEGLQLDEELRSRDGDPWCGVLVIDLNAASIVEYIRLKGPIQELFDVAVLPGVTCPMAIGPDAPEMRSLHSFDPQLAPLELPAG